VPKKKKQVGRASSRADGRPQGPKSFYKSKPPKSVGRASPRAEEKDFVHAKPIPSAHFELRDDGTIQLTAETPRRREEENKNEFGGRPQDLRASAPPRLIFSSENPFLRLYHGNCLELLDAIAAKYPEGRFDAIFADPPYFLSNGGISCHAGRMVKVDSENKNVNRRWY
jgi:hypothetical protein